ncbi:DNA-binding transcriptional response regulator, NtrC family, contains REC, AAA-type ATPase, and a Fis-type DNA-binding domains [Thiohalospira halophila DSM 15071]|uniref:DNA-binding transcriptional response regulator, NtrC family, contains REC, AAA-type ATPase, and a Fis-type DNA-binding domains n=1 Tax=Thiohalospira halophila DSM 15071 TaxID=1123397 RepID=A0A1I1NBT7_9GAMM|nr:sigma-54 dependent transcriptional regulator [Thiohalospira halophila]SFC95151.1 DNA-binding transcriptional response regulator, NtrC family, contains REC, AAA-type ATPase, and a Fis-type DNA-binding domains [Thiohalospira halophila DSM 15071]
MSTLLVVEDEAITRDTLTGVLERAGHRVTAVDSAEAARTADPSTFDLVLTDLRLPGAAGTDLIAIAEPTPVIVLTSYASVRSAVDSMKQGAVDYLAKPFDHDELVLLVDRTLRTADLERQNAALKSQVEAHYPVGGMIGESPAMQAVFDRLQRVAPTSATVLVLGESGTGKELAARAIHDASPRKDGPFITVNCAAIPAGLIESELFGHEKGAFTGADRQHRGLVEAAEGGTLFLDEIGELPAEAQARLLRVLQAGEVRRVGATGARHVDVRLVAATHRDLRTLVAKGDFREDLYYRLQVMEIRLPPLRERGGDVEALAEALLERACHRLNRPPLALTEAARRAVREHDWPGNVRELENAIERAVILADSEAIDTAALGLEPTPARPEGPTDDLSLDEYFIHFVRSHEGELTETELARRLGVSRKTLWERRQRLGIPRRPG